MSILLSDFVVVIKGTYDQILQKLFSCGQSKMTSHPCSIWARHYCGKSEGSGAQERKSTHCLAFRFCQQTAGGSSSTQRFQRHSTYKSVSFVGLQIFNVREMSIGRKCAQKVENLREAKKKNVCLKFSSLSYHFIMALWLILK